MAGKQCKFNKLWLDAKIFPEFSGWLDLVVSDATLAYCKVCRKSFKLSNMGRNAVVSHSKGPNHLKNMQAKNSQPAISFFTKKNVLAPTSSEDVHPLPGTSSTPDAINLKQETSQTSLKTFSINEDDVTSAEAIWALEVVTGKMSLNSCDETSAAFKRMFPDSKIAQSFCMGKTKASYLINHGLAPYFQEMLQKEIRQCADYVVSFDESLNKVVQRGQMDLCVRFWDVNLQRVSTRYWNSTFLGRASADHLLDAFIDGLDLPLQNILQVSLDGPNVNLSFLKKLENHLQILNPDGKSILDIGICSLHTVNGAIKTAINKCEWNLSQFFRSLYNFFKGSPARRAKYTEITSSKSFPFKFTSVRWLENGPCVDQTIKIFDHVSQFIKEYAEEKENKNLQYLRETMKDPFLKAKLCAFRSILSDIEPFLRRFQSQKPMVPYLFSSIEELLKKEMMRFIKPEKIREANTSQKLINLDLHLFENLAKVEKIDVGFGAKNILRQIKSSEKDKLAFRIEFRTLLITMINKLKEKSPLKCHLARGLTALDPKLILLKPDLAITRIDTVLENMYSHKRISDQIADKAKVQFSSFVEEVQKNESVKHKLDDFIREKTDEIGLDEFYYTLLGEDRKYVELWSVMKLCFILSHGNAFVESGFSINKNLLVENLLEESLVSQRIIIDSVKHLGGVKNITITKSMLTSVRSSRRRYQMYLDKKKEKTSEEEKKKIEKRKIQLELKELEESRKKLKIEREKEDAEIEKKKQMLEAMKKQH